MQIEVNELDYCKLAIHYEASSEEIENKKTEVLNIFKKAPVPGFRPGKANIEAIKVHYKNQINESLKRALAEEAYHNTLFEKGLRPLGNPSFNGMVLHGGKFTCDFSLNVKPDFTLAPYKGIEVVKPPMKDVSTETELMLQQLRVKFGVSNPYSEDDFVTDNDNVILNYNGFVDGEKLDNISSEGEMLTVGHSELKDFDLNLLGMKTGETRKFDLVVPQNTALPSLKGKTITFEVTLVNGSKTIPCALDDELASKFGKSNFQELHQAVAEAANARISHLHQGDVLAKISNLLVDANDFKVPDWLSLAEGQYLAYQGKTNWDHLNDEDKNKYIEVATTNVKLSLILDKIRDEEPDAQLSDQEVLDMIRDTLSKTNPGASPDETIKQMSSNGQLQMLFVRIRDEHVLDFVFKNAKIVE